MAKLLERMPSVKEEGFLDNGAEIYARIELGAYEGNSTKTLIELRCDSQPFEPEVVKIELRGTFERADLADALTWLASALRDAPSSKSPT